MLCVAGKTHNRYKVTGCGENEITVLLKEIIETAGDGSYAGRCIVGPGERVKNPGI
jgi:hypothetical protein